MSTVHAYLLSDRPGAAYAMASVILGGTFAGIVAFVALATTLVSLVR